MMNLLVEFPRSRQNSRAGASPRVSFADIAEVKSVECLPSQYKADLWFSQLELNYFKSNAAILRRKMISDSTTMMILNNFDAAAEVMRLLNVQDTSAYMGLERYLTLATFEETVFRRKGLVRAMRLEQKRQRSIGIYDPDALTSVSEAWSEWSRDRASLVGLLHASSWDVPLQTCWLAFNAVWDFWQNETPLWSDENHRAAYGDACVHSNALNTETRVYIAMNLYAVN